MRFRTFSTCVVALAMVVGLASCSGSNDNAGTEIEFTNGSYTETLVEAQITSLFAQIYDTVLPTLSVDQVGGKTLFAPNNAAIEKYLAENSVTIEDLIAQPEIATQLVLGHLFERTISATELLNLNGESVAMLKDQLFQSIPVRDRLS